MPQQGIFGSLSHTFKSSKISTNILFLTFSVIFFVSLKELKFVGIDAVQAIFTSTTGKTKWKAVTTARKTQFSLCKHNNTGSGIAFSNGSLFVFFTLSNAWTIILDNKNFRTELSIRRLAFVGRGMFADNFLWRPIQVL